ncbi:MAG TPA: hypothetical protein VNX47_05685 [Nevskia sp.]|nr:hypothetical protein [Nevskia sp.]
MAPTPQVQSFNAPAAASRAKAEETASGATLPDPCASPQRLPAQKRAQPEVRQDAAAWLEQIRKLRDTAPGAARAELACFAARNPQAEVPDDLKALMPGQP